MYWTYILKVSADDRVDGQRKLSIVVKANCMHYCVQDREGVGMGSGQRVPFQRAVSVDGKTLSGPGMTGRRSAPSSLVKQEHIENQIGMGESLIFWIFEFLNMNLMYVIV